MPDVRHGGWQFDLSARRPRASKEPLGQGQSLGGSLNKPAASALAAVRVLEPGTAVWGQHKFDQQNPGEPWTSIGRAGVDQNANQASGGRAIVAPAVHTSLLHDHVTGTHQHISPFAERPQFSCH